MCAIGWPFAQQCGVGVRSVTVSIAGTGISSFNSQPTLQSHEIMRHAKFAIVMGPDSQQHMPTNEIGRLIYIDIYSHTVSTLWTPQPQMVKRHL